MSRPGQREGQRSNAHLLSGRPNCARRTAQAIQDPRARVEPLHPDQTGISARCQHLRGEKSHRRAHQHPKQQHSVPALCIRRHGDGAVIAKKTGSTVINRCVSNSEAGRETEHKVGSETKNEERRDSLCTCKLAKQRKALPLHTST